MDIGGTWFLPGKNVDATGVCEAGKGGLKNSGARSTSIKRLCSAEVYVRIKRICEKKCFRRKLDATDERAEKYIVGQNRGKG